MSVYALRRQGQILFGQLSDVKDELSNGPYDRRSSRKSFELKLFRIGKSSHRPELCVPNTSLDILFHRMNCTERWKRSKIAFCYSVRVSVSLLSVTMIYNDADTAVCKLSISRGSFALSQTSLKYFLKSYDLTRIPAYLDSCRNPASKIWQRPRGYQTAQSGGSRPIIQYTAGSCASNSLRLAARSSCTATAAKAETECLETGVKNRFGDNECIFHTESISIPPVCLFF